MTDLRLADGTGRDAVEWTYDPRREHPARAAVAAVVALALALLAFRTGLPFLVAAALAVACTLSVSPALAPARCRVDAAGVARGGLLGWNRRAWSEVRRARCGRRALLVSPYADRHWLDAWRALALPLPERGDAEVRRALQDLLARHGFGA